MPAVFRRFGLVCLLALGGMTTATAQGGEPPPLTAGQTVYVPVYSHVQHGNQDRRGKPDEWLLSAMLSIRNTDPARPLTVKSIRYYDSDGHLLRDYTSSAKKLGPLASMEIFVENKDRSGGAGANFLVAWEAEKPINAPIIETVHANVFGTHSAVFTSSGQALQAGN